MIWIRSDPDLFAVSRIGFFFLFSPGSGFWLGTHRIPAFFLHVYGIWSDFGFGKSGYPVIENAEYPAGYLVKFADTVGFYEQENANVQLFTVAY